MSQYRHFCSGWSFGMVCFLHQVMLKLTIYWESKSLASGSDKYIEKTKMLDNYRSPCIRSKSRITSWVIYHPSRASVPFNGIPDVLRKIDKLWLRNLMETSRTLTHNRHVDTRANRVKLQFTHKIWWQHIESSDVEYDLIHCNTHINYWQI